MKKRNDTSVTISKPTGDMLTELARLKRLNEPHMRYSKSMMLSDLIFNALKKEVRK